MRILANQNFNFIRWRWHAIALSVAHHRGRPVAVVSRGGLPLGIDFSGGTVDRAASSPSRSAKKPCAARWRRSRRNPSSSRSAAAARTRSWSGCPMLAGHRDGRQPRGGRQARRGDAARRQPRRVHAGARRSSGRSSARTCSARASTPRSPSLVGIMTYIALRFRLSFGVGAIVASVHDVLVTLAILTLVRLRAVAQRHRRDPDAHRLRRERHDRRLRPRAREPAHEPARPDGHGHQPEREPDAAADGDHRRRDVSGRARPLPVRRRSARGLRVHDARRHHHEHLLDDLHRVGRRDRC